MSAPGPTPLDWHLITCEFPPQIGGVSDHSYVIARALSVAGERVHVWSPEGAGSTPDTPGVEMHLVRDPFSLHRLWRFGRALDRTPNRRIFLQWVPHGYGYHSLNVPFAAWVAWRAWVRKDELYLMVHEPYLAWSSKPKYMAMSALHRVMLALVASGATRIWMSTPSWSDRLAGYIPKQVPLEWLPVPAPAVPGTRLSKDERAGSDRQPLLIGHFSTHSPVVTSILEPAIAMVLARSNANMLLIGRDSDRVRARLADAHPTLANRIRATAVQDMSSVIESIRRCDLMLQPYPDGITVRNTSMLLALACGSAVVSNSGPMTEPLWQLSGAVMLAESPTPAPIAQRTLDALNDPTLRAGVAAAALRLYRERFDVSHAVALLVASASPRTSASGVRAHVQTRRCRASAPRAWSRASSPRSYSSLRLPCTRRSSCRSRNVTRSKPLWPAVAPRVLFFVEGFTDIRFVTGLSEIAELTLCVPAVAYAESGLRDRVAASGAHLHVAQIPGRRLAYQVRSFGWLWRHAQDFDVILSQELLRGSLNATLVGAARGVPVVTTMSLAPVEYFRCRRQRGQINPFTAWAGETVIRTLMTINGRLSKRCVALGTYIQSIAQTYCRRTVLGGYYGVDVDYFRPASDEEKCQARQRLDLPADAFIIFLASRISHEKDPETALRATARAREHGLNAVLLNLSGGFRDFLATAERIGLDGTGRWIIGRPAVHPMAEVADYFRAADAVVQPSLAEGLGLSPLEALACGIPVVATDIGGMATTLPGFARLVPLQDPEAMARELLWIAGHAAEAREQALRGRAMVARHWSRTKAFEDLARTLNDVIPATGATRAAESA